MRDGQGGGVGLGGVGLGGACALARRLGACLQATVLTVGVRKVCRLAGR